MARAELKQRLVTASTIMDSRYGREAYLLVSHDFAAMVYGEVVEWLGRMMEFGMHDCVSFDLQEDAPRVIFACACASEGMN